MYLEPSGCQPTVEAVEAIRNANAVVFGPGSLFTSIIPNLLIDKMVDAIVQSKALKIYICNVMTQHRETKGYRASDHLQALVAHTNPGIVQVCVVNTGRVPPTLLDKYRQEGAFPVEADVDRIRAMGYQVLAHDIVSTEDYVRHDSDQVAKLVIQLIIGTRGRPHIAAAVADKPVRA